MIPSIILGVDQTEEEYEKFKRGETCIDQYNKYRKLDEVIRQQNLNRTNGLLPGILSSKIIAEAMLTRLDMELKEAGVNFVRYVDDYEVFLYGDDDEKRQLVNLLACSILINDKEEYTLSPVDVNNILKLLNRHIIYEHDLEVIWLLYLLIKTDNLESGNSIIDSIVGTQNELAYLVLLHNNLLDDQQKDTIKQKAHSWILLYEMYSNDVLSETEFFEKLSIHKNGNMYRKFKTNGIHFIV